MSPPPDALSEQLYRWLDLTPLSAQWRFLEAHPALVSPASEMLLAAWIPQTTERSQASHLSTSLDLRRDIRQLGGTLTAIREAALNQFGGGSSICPPL